MIPLRTQAEAEAAAEETRRLWEAMSEDDRRAFLRSRAGAVPAKYEELTEAYIEYVATVSPDWMAISFPAAAFLEGLCADGVPAMVADFGSGFSSYVLRRYAKDSGARVLSVDDSPEWLANTAAFLESRGLPTDDLVTWDDWLDTRDQYPPFDLVFHDIASGELRERSMALVADEMRTGGVLVFDDAQHAGHMEAMTAVANAHGWVLACLPETRDGNGRFDAMVICRAMSAP